MRVAREHAQVALAPEVRPRLAAARAVVERAASRDDPVYGVTTGLGAAKDTVVPADDRTGFQARAVTARAVAVGPALPTDVVRAMLLARASGMATGGSGVTPAVLDGLVAMLNAGVHPVVPTWGSIGAADLGLLAAAAAPLIGLGEAEFRGERLPGAEAMKRAGLVLPTLGPKDGLALVSANAASVGQGALVIADSRAAVDQVTIAAALAMEAFRAHPSPLTPAAQEARPAPGQREAAARLRTLLDGSALWQGGARSFQAPISYRCASQVLGAALAAIGTATAAVEVELNAAADNPLVLADADTIVHTGNFHVAALAQAFDLLAIALASVATASRERVIRLMSPAASGLPLNLTRYDGSRTGYATVQKTLTALVAEMRHLANPGSLDALPVSEGVEDHASHAPWTVRKASDAVERLRYVAAIELLIAAQAIDLGDVPRARLGRGACAAYDAVRGVVAMLDDDRPPGIDIAAVHALLVRGELA